MGSGILCTRYLVLPALIDLSDTNVSTLTLLTYRNRTLFLHHVLWNRTPILERFHTTTPHHRLRQVSRHDDEPVLSEG